MAAGAPGNRPTAREDGSQQRRANLVVRPARTNDLSKLSAFIFEAWRQAGPAALGFSGATEGAVREIATEEFLKKRLASPSVRMMIAEEGPRIIGFSSVRKVSEGEAELSGIVVLQTAAGRGVGTRLIRKTLDAARKRGFRSVKVKAEANNERAIRFYKSAGFNESGKAAARVGATRMAFLVLTRRLG